MLVKKPNIIVGTLGRIKDMIDKEYLSLKSLKMLILDEADKFCLLHKYKGNNKNGKS